MRGTPHYLRVALALAGVTGLTLGCGAGTATSPEPATASTTTAPESTGKSGDTVGVAAPSGKAVTSGKVSEYTAGDGPCRCSWDKNPAAAPRVCKKGEVAYGGAHCVPASREDYDHYDIGGPLPPPDLPA
jgi:hypothetical protein